MARFWVTSSDRRDCKQSVDEMPSCPSPILARIANHMSDDRDPISGAFRTDREIIAPHVEPVQPVSEVKNVLLQASLSQLHTKGLYPRYDNLVDPGIPEEISSTLAMSWVPVDLAVAHYRACENMTLGSAVLKDLGAGVGERMKGTSLVSTSKSMPTSSGDLWTSSGALLRMWARHYRGGSVQVAKLGACEMELDLRGFVLNQFRYFRHAQLEVIAAAFAAIGARETMVKIVQYSGSKDELTLRISWT